MGYPAYIDWSIAAKCNLHCRHCVGMETGELTHDEAVRVTTDIISLKPKWVILEGGEPLMRKDLTEVGSMLHKACIDIFVITNGNAFTEKRLQELVSYSPKVLFSMDGADAEVYEYVKRGASFEKAIKWAERCAGLGIFHGFTVVLTMRNMGQIKEFIRLVERLGGKRIIFLPLKPFGTNGGSNPYYEQNALTPEEHDKAIKEIYSAKSKVDFFYDEPFLWNFAARNGLSVSGSDSGITIPEVEGCAASCSMYIQNDGSVLPCMFCPTSLSFGNAAKESLPEIWRKMESSPVLTAWAEQKSRSGACAVCVNFKSCRGCLARTAVLLGDPLASDPCCPNRKK